jgi:hypothetical protein
MMLMQTGQAAAASAASMQVLLWLAARMSSAPSAVSLSAVQMQLLQPHQH